MKIQRGRCTECGVATWRSMPHPITGKEMLLWPDPASVYADVIVEDNGLAPGIGFCATCAPPTGSQAHRGLRTVPGLRTARYVGLVHPAGERYAAWFTDQMETFLTRWIPEELKMDPTALLRQWAADRQEAQRGR